MILLVQIVKVKQSEEENWQAKFGVDLQRDNHQIPKAPTCGVFSLYLAY